ncbi:hypothetical protein AC578_1068 [Pseudocercospora eumusae]|uniref:Uncharacterized protein n=1 Tax=Pseudocercospora eumusae TaxID=321146 RepID=A0A139HTQ1_9PEZI|nr:hypothetical protein AC578_1068 [Pseudocercospora eumusae]
MAPKRSAKAISTNGGFLPPATISRKRAALHDADGNASDKENAKSPALVQEPRAIRAVRAARKQPVAKTQSSQEDSGSSEPDGGDEDDAPPKKKAKSAPKSTAAKGKTIRKPASTKSKPEAKAADDQGSAKKMFEKAVQETEKKVSALDKRVKAMGGNSTSITIEHYADNAAQQLKVVTALAKVDQNLAFNLTVFLGDAAATDLDATIKMCGYGDHEAYFERLDDALLPLIANRKVPKEKLGELPEVPHRWTRDDAQVGIFKTGWPNKAQRKEMVNQKHGWEGDRREQRLKRRLECDDWVSVALSDLVENRDYLDQYGVKGFFKDSIARLQEMDAAR